MKYDLSDLANLITSLYTDQYYTVIDLKRDLTLNRINLSKYVQEYRDTRVVPRKLIEKLSPIVKESQVKRFIQLTIAENLNRDFSKHLSASYRRKFKEREAYLLAQSLAPIISKTFYPQSVSGSKRKYVTGVEGLQRALKNRAPIYIAAIEKQLQTLYTKGYMYALDENLKPITVDGKVQLLKDHKGVDISVAPLRNKNFKYYNLWEFVMDNNAHRKRKKSKIFSVPSSWKVVYNWERTLVFSSVSSKSSEYAKISAEFAKGDNPLVRRLVEENSRSYYGLLTALANSKKSGMVRSSDSAKLTGYRKVQKLIYPERKNLRSKFKSGFLWADLSNNFSGEKRFSDNYEDAFGKKLNKLSPNQNTGKFTRRQFISNTINNTKLSKRLRGIKNIEATKRPSKRKRKNLLKFLDFIVLAPAFVFAFLRGIVDKALFEVAKYVGDEQGITYSLLRNVDGEGLAGRLLTSLDGVRFGFGVAKMMLKDGFEALIPGLLAGIAMSSPVGGVIVGSVYFGSKFFLDFTTYFSEQNPLVVNMVQRIATTMTDRALSLPELIVKTGTFGITSAVIGTIVAAIFGISGIPLMFTGLGIFAVTSVFRAVDLSFVGKVLGDYTEASDLVRSSFLFKSEYLFEIGGPSAIVGILGFILFGGNPLFLGFMGVGLVSGSIADFFKSSLFEDSVLHDISGVSAYDISHVGIGFIGGGALIGSVFGPIGAVVGAIAVGVPSIIITIVGKRGARFIVHPDIVDLKFEPGVFDPKILSGLDRYQLYDKLAESGYSSDMLDKFYGEKGLYEYLHDPNLIDHWDLNYISKEFRDIRADTLLERQELLRTYGSVDPSAFYRESLDRIALDKAYYLKEFGESKDLADALDKFGARADIRDVLYRSKDLTDATANLGTIPEKMKFEDFLKSLSQGNRFLDTTLVDNLSRDTTLSDLYARGDMENLLKEIYREDIKSIAGFTEEDMKAIDKSLVNSRDLSKFGVKAVSKEMNSYYRMSDVLKNPEASSFVNPESLRAGLIKFVEDKGGSIGDLSNPLTVDSLKNTTDFRQFLSDRGLNLSSSYSDFIKSFNDSIFKGFDLSSSFAGSDFFKLLANTNLPVGTIFPNLVGLDAETEANLNLRSFLLTDPARFEAIFNSEFLNSSLVGIDLPNLIRESLVQSGMGSLGKIAVTAQVNLSETLNLTTADLFKSLNSAMIGGAVLSVIFGITTPVGFIAVTGAYLGIKTGLTILGNIKPETAALNTFLSKATIGKASEFIGDSLTPGLLGYLVGSYLFGPIGGALVGVGTGVGWATYRMISDSSKLSEAVGGFTKFVGEKILDPAFLVYLDTQLTTSNFWEGLFFQHGGMAAFQSWSALVMGTMSAFALGGTLASIGAFVLGAAFGITGIAGIITGGIGFVVVGAAVWSINSLLVYFFQHGIFYYIGDFLKNIYQTVSGWFFHSAAIASIGLDILIGIIALFFKGEFDIDDFLRTIFIMVLGWALMMSLMGAGATSGGNNNNTANVVNHRAPHAATFLYTSGKIVNIQNNPSNSLADTVFIKTSAGIVKINTTNPYLYKGEILNKGEYLGQ